MLAKLLKTYEIKDKCANTLRRELKNKKIICKNEDLDIDNQRLWLKSNLSATPPTSVRIFLDTDDDIVFLKASKFSSKAVTHTEITKEVRTLAGVESSVQELLLECYQFLEDNK